MTPYTLKSELREAAKSVYLNALRPLDDRAATRIDFLRVLGKLPNLDRPLTFSEKIQHYKLHGHDHRMPALVDKLLVKEHVARVLGSDWVTPTLWSGERVTEAELREVGAPAVIKPNHASGKIAFISSGAKLRAVARKANAWLKQDYHLLHREWAYGETPRRLMIEQKIEFAESPIDYKFWVLDGEVRLIQADFARFTRHTRRFFDPSWRPLDLKLKYPVGDRIAPRPPHLDEMLSAAARLADDFRFVRVDLYDTPERPVFGEITFWPEAGLCRFEPSSFDSALGAEWAYPGRHRRRAEERWRRWRRLKDAVH